ncbi:hypothetical protein C8Q72DRAFT_779948 [Fomitopsis betulina]|nr:hypothetical protein C8Q72DRAFT_779948 [Fomitopsis betulina]
MAPNFFAKFVNRSPSNSISGRSSADSRSGSPGPPHKFPPSIILDSPASSGVEARPRRHTLVGTPSYNGSTESFPNVTVVPPSPRSTTYGSDIHDGDSARSRPTLFDGPENQISGNGSAKRVPSIPDLGSPFSTNTNSSVTAVEDAGLTTPTPATTRTAFFDTQMADHSLARPKSATSLRKSPSHEVLSPTDSYSRSRMLADGRSPVKDKGREQSRSRSPGPSPVTVTEDGVLTTSPTSSDFPGSVPNTSVSSKFSAAPSMANSLLVPDNSDAASVYSYAESTSGGRKRKVWARKPRSPTTDSQRSPTSSALSLSPKRKPTGIAGAIAALNYAASDYSDRDSYRSGDELLDGGSGLEDDDDLDLDADDIPVTGFAVASNKRNQDFHELFPSVPEGDYLIEDYGCALQREILIQGRLYVSENHLCFHANIFGWITDLCIPMYDVTALEKRMTAFVIPNAILVTTTQQKYTFTSFLSRDNTHDVIYNVWRLARPGASSALPSPRASLDMPDSTSDVVASAKAAVVKPKATICECGRKGEHFSEVAMESVLWCLLPHWPMLTQCFPELQISDWMPLAEGSTLLYRQMSYTKPLNGSIGPKSAKCELRDEMLHLDFDDYVTMMTTTRTPEVPSGGAFSVKTKTCITWASAVSSKITVTTQVEWTGRSFIKGIIEKSAIDGQKTYHSDLESSMRKYIHEHQSEFIPEGVDVAAVEEAEAQATDSARPSMEQVSLSELERRKSRKYERNQRGLQWAYDTIEGAFRVGKQSAEGAWELIKDAWDQSSSTAILYFVIVFLVVSNVWTLLMVGSREEAGRRKEMRRTEEREKWVQGVVTTLWEELLATKNTGGGSGGGATWAAQQRAPSEWREEVAEMRAALDSVEQRVAQIRQSLNALD